MGITGMFYSVFLEQPIGGEVRQDREDSEQLLQSSW